MRIDKFLKISRIIKRRTVANEACASGKVLINGKTAKSSSEVAVGDEVSIQFGTKEIRVRVVEIDEKKGKDGAKELFSYLD